MTKETGGQAFPHVQPRDPSFDYAEKGMTLRDYYAAKAMAALIGMSNLSDYARYPRIAADRAFQFADAMLGAHK